MVKYWKVFREMQLDSLGLIDPMGLSNPIEIEMENLIESLNTLRNLIEKKKLVNAFKEPVRSCMSCSSSL